MVSVQLPGLLKFTGIKNLLISITIIISLSNCGSGKNGGSAEITPFKSLTAQAETKPVPGETGVDAADDPAIWVNYSNPDSSRIIGTDKKGGLAVYDLSGHELYYYKTGLMNNADLRHDFPMPSGTIDILAVSNRTDQSVDLFKINQNGSLETIHKDKLKSMLKEEVYGLCMYKSRISEKFYVFVNGKDGSIEQWELIQEDNKINGKIVRTLKLDTQTEGMVADDENGVLYVGEEDMGIWKFNAEPASADIKELLTYSTEKENPGIVYDIEGLALYKLQNGEGYLIASSQGNDSYAIFERQSPNKYLGSIKILDGIVDGSQQTDGLDITGIPLGNNYPAGLLVVQDGENKDAGRAVAQNFKLIRWDSIVTKFNPRLKTN
jgi:3-phytase